ncbi:lipid transfer-like protein VAS [Abrus precatorius]|uniref:Lipid transfer-like protein VAS n=1 Tax=Abrus precatorius TaxID=3816 RepID=A0A8B8JZS3_ABRPR|nr:lipid transfer-like protein VAS [Abrus precatorius]
MGSGLRNSMCLASLMLATVLMMASSAEAQSSGGGVPSCAQQLIPCLDYLNNSAHPPNSCCDPLKNAVATQLSCLCNLFNTPGLLQNFNISIDNALQLSRNCGVTSGISSCQKSSTAPPPTSGGPPATPGGDKGGAGRVSFSGLSFLLLFWASMLFN